MEENNDSAYKYKTAPLETTPLVAEERTEMQIHTDFKEALERIDRLENKAKKQKVLTSILASVALALGSVGGGMVGYGVGNRPDGKIDNTPPVTDTLERTQPKIETKETKYSAEIKKMEFVLEDEKVFFSYDFTFEGKHYIGKVKTPYYDNLLQAQEANPSEFSTTFDFKEYQERDLRDTGSCYFDLFRPGEDAQERTTLTFIKNGDKGFVLEQIIITGSEGNYKEGKTISIELKPLAESK